MTLLCLACSAQSPPAKDLGLSRRIENQIRANFPVPTDVNVNLGERKSGDLPGFDDLTVTLSRGTQSQELHFLISKDNKTLAKLQKFDLTSDLMSKIDVTGRPFKGGKDAKVVIVNFDDFECPFCSRMHQTLFPTISKYYGEKIKIIYKDYPLVQIHPWASRAAVDGNCLVEQNIESYWAFADYAHANQQEITGVAEGKNEKDMAMRLDRAVVEMGKKFNLDASRLQACISAQKVEKVLDSMKEGDQVGVDSTPTLFINGERILGALSETELKKVIDRALIAAGEIPPSPPQAKDAAAASQAGASEKK